MRIARFWPVPANSLPSEADLAIEGRVLLGAAAAFVPVHVAIFAFGVNAQALIEADALTFHRMALQFLASADFGEQQRQPLYPLLIAGALRIAGERGMDLLVAAQVAMAFGTGMVARQMFRPWLGGAGSAVLFALVILNPNAVALAHWPLADTLNALVFSCSVWALLAYARDARVWQAGVCGLALGLSAVTRPETQFLLYVLPLAPPLASIVAAPPRFREPRVLVSGLVATAAALVVVLPWAMQVRSVDDAYVLSSATKTLENARGHYALIEAERTGYTQADIVERLMAEEAVAAEQQQDRAQILANNYIRQIFTSDPIIVGRLFAKAWIAQFASGGAQSLNRVLGISFERPDKILNQPGAVSAFFGTLAGQSVAGTLVTILAVGLALLLRGLGLVGLMFLIVRRLWLLLLVIGVVLSFKAGVHLFYGLARYRLSVEPLLMMLAVFGWQQLRAAFLRRRG